MDYNDAFANISYLLDSKGTTYKPLSYEGSGGHHASGILRFAKIEGNKFELIIQDVGGVKEESLGGNLNVRIKRLKEPV